MCGIAGAIWTDPAYAVRNDILKRMTDKLAHRGPDDSGTHTSRYQTQPPYPDSPGVALGHRRLAIIDPERNKQPICNEDQTVWLVFNGEIYNYRQLRKRLEGNGHTFQTNGDSESIVHLYEDQGLDFLKHLDGMFAFALWDANRRRLVLARDRIGQKPLVYCQQHQRLSFASELKSLLELPDIPREIDPSALDEYLTYQYVPHPNTIYRGIRKLPPGHYGLFEDRQLSVVPYWKPDFNHEFDSSRQATVEELRSRLTRSVQARMQSDVPLGAFLSGGVDSSLIVALMQRESQTPIKTFSIGFPIAEYDETAYAREVAQQIGTEHHEFRVEPNALDILPKLTWHYDEPFADSSALPTYYLSEVTRNEVKVALSGDGGDELFAGYRRYQAVRLAVAIERLPRPLYRLVAAEFWARLPGGSRGKSILRRGKWFRSALPLTRQRRYGRWISIFTEQQRAALYTDAFMQTLPDSDPHDFLEAAFVRAGNRDAVTAATLVDILTYLPCDLMTKVDIASMAHGLECRQPFLDYRVVELAAGIPIRMKLRGNRGKRILEEAFGDVIPRKIFRRRKMGFGVPLDHWFRGALKQFATDILLDRKTTERGYFRTAAVERLLQEHTSRKLDHAPRLWALLFLELWMREWIDR